MPWNPQMDAPNSNYKLAILPLPVILSYKKVLSARRPANHKFQKICPQILLSRGSKATAVIFCLFIV
jgi:hypothetical protein